jgi:hypothetical protein
MSQHQCHHYQNIIEGPTMKNKLLWTMYLCTLNHSRKSCVFLIIMGWESNFWLVRLWVIFQLYHDKNKLHFDEIMIILYVLYKINMISWIFIVLAHWNNSPWQHMSLSSDTLSWIPANQCLPILLNTPCLVKKQQTSILLFLIWPDLDSHDLLHSRRAC